MASPIFERFPVVPLDELAPGTLARLGGWYIRGWGDASALEGQPAVISPLHGRAAVVRDPLLGAVSIKGIGWTRGPLCLLPSPKDAQLFFGLYARRDAVREWHVSRFLAARGVRATRILGYAKNQAPGLPPSVPFADGSPVEPTLLYVQVRSPYRVADLPWLAPGARKAAVAEAAAAAGWPAANFVAQFCHSLADTMAAYHRAGCINDSLSADNVTLAAEITDFEWFTTPDRPLPDGSQFEDLVARRLKEAIYAYEIACLLCDALDTPAAKVKILEWLEAGYRDGDEAVACYFQGLLQARDGFLA